VRSYVFCTPSFSQPPEEKITRSQTTWKLEKKLNSERKELWVVISKSEGERYITLVAAPNKELLKKTFTRFLRLTEIPLEPIIFTAEQ